MKKGLAQILALVWAGLMIAILSSALTLAVSGSGDRRAVTQEEYDTIKRYARLDEVRALLMTQYYKPVEEDALMTGAIRGMVSALKDNYSYYYTPEEMTREKEDDAGRYFGIGVLVERNGNGNIEIVRVYKGGPAEAAGLQLGDLIVAVDGEPVDALTASNYRGAVAKMRGAENTEVTVGVRRDGKTMEYKIIRSNLSISYAEYSLINGSVGYVSISQFTGDVADRFDDAVAYFQSNGVEGMVIDLRNNPGGYLDYVTRIADRILPEGVIVYIEDRSGNREYMRSDADFYDVPVVVLVNEMSASASEILAASVQALGRGKVVGITTYGKGVVQTLTTFREDGAGIQYTTASYFDANGRSINGVGVTPDLEVALDGSSVPFQPDPESDNQLAAALRVLSAMNTTKGE